MIMPSNALLLFFFFEDYFCLIPNTNIAFVVIAKSGKTFFKKVAYYNSTEEGIRELNEAKNVLAYTKLPPFLISISKMVGYEWRI